MILVGGLRTGMMMCLDGKNLAHAVLDRNKIFLGTGTKTGLVTHGKLCVRF